MALLLNQRATLLSAGAPLEVPLSIPMCVLLLLNDARVVVVVC